MTTETNDEPKDTEGAVKALRAERLAHKATQDKLKLAEDAVTAANAKAQEATALANPNAAGLAALVADSAKALTARATGELQARLVELEAGLDTATKSNVDLAQRLDAKTIQDAVRTAAAESFVLPNAIADLLIFATADLKVVDGEVKTAGGASVAEWLDGRKSTSPYLWPLSKGAGAHGSSEHMPRYDGNDNPFKSGPGFNLTRAGQILSTDPERGKRLQELANVK